MSKYNSGIPWWALLNLIIFVPLGIAFIAFLESFPSVKILWIILIIVCLLWGFIAGGIFAVGLFNSLGKKPKRKKTIDVRIIDESSIESNRNKMREMDSMCPTQGRVNPGGRR